MDTNNVPVYIKHDLWDWDNMKYVKCDRCGGMEWNYWAIENNSIKYCRRCQTALEIPNPIFDVQNDNEE